MDMEKVIKGLECHEKGAIGCQHDCPYGNEYSCQIVLCHDALALLKEWEQGYANLLADYEDLQKEHEKLIDKKIPLITQGQEVIRCKDCRFYETDSCGNGCCGNISGICAEIVFVKPDWFCADGEKR